MTVPELPVCLGLPPKPFPLPSPSLQPEVSVGHFRLHTSPLDPPLRQCSTVGANSQPANDMHVTLEILYFTTLSLPLTPTPAGLPPALPWGITGLVTGPPASCPVPSNPTPLPTRWASESLPYFKVLLGCKTSQAPYTPSVTWILPVVTLIFYFIQDDTELRTVPHTQHPLLTPRPLPGIPFSCIALWDRSSPPEILQNISQGWARCCSSAQLSPVRSCHGLHLSLYQSVSPPTIST